MCRGAIYRALGFNELNPYANESGMLKILMDVTYGQGEYIEDQKHFDGKVILSEHKLFLRGSEGDYAPTYIPLEKIEKIKQTGSGLEVYVFPGIMSRYVAVFKMEKVKMKELVLDLVSRRGLKKKFFSNVWEDVSL